MNDQELIRMRLINVKSTIEHEPEQLRGTRAVVK